MDNDHLNGKTLDELFQLRFRKGLQIKITVGIAAKSGPHKLRIHITGLAQPMYVIATNIGKIPLMPDYYIQGASSGTPMFCPAGRPCFYVLSSGTPMFLCVSHFIFGLSRRS